MEKINNYTPVIETGERCSNSIQLYNTEGDEVCMLISNTDYITERMESDAKLFKLAPTLYEQHFKMLEALKQIASWQSQEYITDIIELAEQTIKECEL